MRNLNNLATFTSLNYYPFKDYASEPYISCNGQLGNVIATLPRDFIPLVGNLSADPSKGGEVSWITKKLESVQSTPVCFINFQHTVFSRKKHMNPIKQKEPCIFFSSQHTFLAAWVKPEFKQRRKSICFFLNQHTVIVVLYCTCNLLLS